MMASSPMDIPIFYINLASDTQRRQCMEAELQRLKLDGQRIDAIRWTALPEAEQATLYSDALNERQFYVPLVAGEKGCYASHLLAWRQLLQRGDKAMVVLEDDVRFDDRLPAVLAAIARLDQPWDMIKLIGREQEKIRSQRKLVDGVMLVEYARVPSLTAGYVVSRSGAQKLLASRQPFGRPVDVDLRFWWENKLVVLGVTPAVLILDETSLVSSIGQKVGKRRWRSRWRKFRVKLELSVLNFLGKLRRPKLLD